MARKTKKIQMMLTDDEYETFKAEAARIGLGLSTWLRLTARKATRMMEAEK